MKTGEHAASRARCAWNVSPLTKKNTSEPFKWSTRHMCIAAAPSPNPRARRRRRADKAIRTPHSPPPPLLLFFISSEISPPHLSSLVIGGSHGCPPPASYALQREAFPASDAVRHYPHLPISHPSLRRPHPAMCDGSRLQFHRAQGGIPRNPEARCRIETAKANNLSGGAQCMSSVVAVSASTRQWRVPLSRGGDAE